MTDYQSAEYEQPPVNPQSPPPPLPPEEPLRVAAGVRPQPPLARPPEKKGRGCGFWLLIGLLMAVIGFGGLIVLMIVGAIFGGLRGAEYGTPQDQLVETVVEGAGAEKILLLPVTGIIGDGGDFTNDPGMAVMIREMLKKARQDASIRGVLVLVESPGGGITASDIIYNELLSFRTETGLPVVALFGDVAASGGYYVAAAADHIVAHPTTVTGSIGVIMPLFGMQNLLNKIGVEPRPIKSAPMKDAGAFYRDMTPAEREYMQVIVDEYYQRFVSIVSDGMQHRGVEISREELLKNCDGRIFTGEQAQKLGFVDEIGYMQDAVAAICSRAGTNPSQTQFVTYRTRPGLLELILARASEPQPKALNIQIEGLTGRESPRFMYLWTVGNN